MNFLKKLWVSVAHTSKWLVMASLIGLIVGTVIQIFLKLFFPLQAFVFSLELFGIGFLGPAMMATMIAYATSKLEMIYAQVSD